MSGRPGRYNALVDVAGIRVGHHTAAGNGFLTGTTVILGPDGGMVAGVDVRGGGPATRETDLLAPTASVERVHAIVLSGGSAFGLATCTGVTDHLAARRVGLRVGPHPDAIVPLVPGAALFDLGRGGSFAARPDAAFGAAALAHALSDADTPDAPRAGAAQGSIGAGTGAVAAGLKGGIGTASVVLAGGATVGALAAVNSGGTPIDPRTGTLLGAGLLLPGDAGDTAVLPTPDEHARARLLDITTRRASGFDFGAESPDQPDVMHTTLVVVATDAALTKVRCTKLAAVAQNGLARAVNPVHTMDDGDVVFAVATEHAAVPDRATYRELIVAGADVVTRAIVRAMLAAEGVGTAAGEWPSWTDVVGGRPKG